MSNPITHPAADVPAEVRAAKVHYIVQAWSASGAGDADMLEGLVKIAGTHTRPPQPDERQAENALKLLLRTAAALRDQARGHVGTIWTGASDETWRLVIARLRNPI